jgi:hypothetical protein
MKTNTAIVVEALMLGIEVPLGEHSFRLFKKGEDVPLPSGNTGTAEKAWLGIKMIQDSQPVYCGADLTFNQVVQMAEDLPKDEAVLLAAQIALNKDRHREATTRATTRPPLEQLIARIHR